jgi:hypothetical protein
VVVVAVVASTRTAAGVAINNPCLLVRWIPTVRPLLTRPPDPRMPADRVPTTEAAVEVETAASTRMPEAEPIS